jgi:hypothetical protein
MRITFVLANFGLAGGERTIAYWATYLQQRGHQVLLVSPSASRTNLAPASKGMAYMDAPGKPSAIPF